VTGVGSAQDLVPAMGVHSHPPPARGRRPVHNDRRTIHTASCRLTGMAATQQ
jgi:hypothetical protein